MNWDAIGAIGESIGAIGVIVSVIYLAIQVGRNTHSLDASITSIYVETQLNALGPIAQSAETAHLMRVGMDNPEQLDADESMQFFTGIARMVFCWEGLFTLYQKESLSDERWEVAKTDIRSIIGSPGGRSYWSDGRVGWAESFRNQVDKILRDVDGEKYNPTSWNVRGDV